MNIEKENILKVLALFNIDFDIKSYNFFINGFDEQTSEVKIIVKVDLSNEKSLVIKFIRQDMNPHNVIEEQSRFSEHLRERGILTPKRYKSGDSYCITYTFNGLLLDVTVEDYLGKEVKVIDNTLAYNIGRLMGKNHCIAEEDNLYINANTIFNIVGYNEVSGYNEFVRLGNDKLIEKKLFDEICSIYDIKINRIKSVWGSLPKYATQGDYSINNLSYIGYDELGIFDYNIAGDETLIGDMILEGLLIANEMELTQGLSDTDRPGLFKSFLNGYISQRPLSENERLVFDDIYAISKGLWFTRIQYNDASLVKLIEKKDHEKTTELLREIYKDISCEKFFLI